MTTGMEYGAMGSAAQDWRDISELMDGTVGKLSGASTGSFAPSVQPAAKAFVTAWQDFGRDSADIATGFAEALELNVSDQRAIDEAVRDGFDGRLGPAR
ncbi:MAG: hypothetical protein ABIR39_01570 [Nocardioides sp.]|uniref:hypothetical protein n=1 Tax=Nocardioides sp. TaxID=35761 RepID=UPI003265580A